MSGATILASCLHWASFTTNSVPTLTFRMLKASIILWRFRYASVRISFLKKQKCVFLRGRLKKVLIFHLKTFQGNGRVHLSVSWGPCAFFWMSRRYPRVKASPCLTKSPQSPRSWVYNSLSCKSDSGIHATGGNCKETSPRFCQFTRYQIPPRLQGWVANPHLQKQNSAYQVQMREARKDNLCGEKQSTRRQTGPNSTLPRRKGDSRKEGNQVCCWERGRCRRGRRQIYH